MADEVVLVQHPRNAPLNIASSDDFDPLPASTPTGSLIVYGFSSTLHSVTADNIAAAQASSYLLPWRGETVDRYDVRLLLEEPTTALEAQWQRSGKRKREQAPNKRATEEEEEEPLAYDDSDGEERLLAEEEDKARQREAPFRDECSSGELQLAELELERYRDLSPELVDRSMEEDGATNRRQGTGRQWHYGYNKEQQLAEPREKEVETEKVNAALETSPVPLRPSSPPPRPFIPPFPVPLHIQLPSTLALHELMECTAEWCVQKGMQAEVMLKAMHATHTAFSFLHPTHPLHHYFTFIKHTRPHRERAAMPRTREDGGGDEHRAQSRTEEAVEPTPTVSVTDLSDVSASMASGPPPGIRRKPAFDTTVEAIALSVSETASSVSNLSPDIEQQMQLPQTTSNDAKQVEKEQEAQQADDAVAQQLRAAKQRLLAMIAQRAVS